VRGAKVIAFARRLLDQAAPLAEGSHAKATGYRVVDGQLAGHPGRRPVARPGQPGASSWATRATRRARPVLLQHHGLHIDIQFDRSTPIGKTDPAGVSDVVLEAALSTILDLEDSVAAVDAEDKIVGYRNWLGILKGTLTESVQKGRQDLHARPEPRPHLHAPHGAAKCACTAAA
jgi:malate synthase